MSIFNTSDGEDIRGQGGTFNKGAGGKLIPHNTYVVFSIDEIAWDRPTKGMYADEKLIKVKWAIHAPSEYEDVKLFQKLRVNADDTKRADKDRRMLVAIATNAGGDLLKLDRDPTDDDFMRHLVAKPMMGQIMLMKPKAANGEPAGDPLNWINAVAPREEFDEKSQEAAASSDNKDDDIPF